MQAEEFLRRAKTEIESDPRSRLTPMAKTFLDDPECIVDIHTHIFDRKCLNIWYILLRMGKILSLESLGIEAIDTEMEKMSLLSMSEDDIYREISKSSDDKDEDWDRLEQELDITIKLNETYEFLGMDLKDALKVLRKKDMREILDFYHSDFSITNLDEYKKYKMVTGILQMDLETGWRFSPKRNFKKQIDDIKALTNERAIIPFLALDPRRVDLSGANQNLYELFLDVFTDKNTPFFGVKCYPSLGYFPSDVRLDPIFEICAEKNIPVLTHCGGETVSTFDKTIRVKNSNGYYDFKIPGSSQKERARYLNDPAHWDTVLGKYKSLKLNLGHWGGDDNWLQFSNTQRNARIEKIMQMMKNPDWKVYGDFSFNISEPELFNKFKSTMDQFPQLLERTLYGTDYWVVLPAGKLLEMQKEFLSNMGNHRHKMLKDNVINYLFN